MYRTTGKRLMTLGQQVQERRASGDKLTLVLAGRAPHGKYAGTRHGKRD